jgi:hypothetical protein
MDNPAGSHTLCTYSICLLSSSPICPRAPSPPHLWRRAPLRSGACSHNCVRYALLRRRIRTLCVHAHVLEWLFERGAPAPEVRGLLVQHLVVDPRLRRGARRCWATAAARRRPVWARSAWLQARLATRSARRRPVTATPRTARSSPSPAPPATPRRPARRAVTSAPSMEKMMHRMAITSWNWASNEKSSLRIRSRRQRRSWLGRPGLRLG